MNTPSLRLAAAAAVLAALTFSAGPGSAKPKAATAQTTIDMGSEAPLKGAEAEDAKVVDDAYAAYNEGGFAALESHLEGLKAVLARAPAVYPMVQTGPDGVIVRSGEDDQLSLLMAAAMTTARTGQPARKSVTVRHAANVYPGAAMLLGSYANEMKSFDDALIYLDKGLAMQPTNPSLVGEKGAALVGQGRLAEVVALYDAALASSDAGLLSHRGRYLRGRGVALIDLNRLDEAQKSLEDSIAADPDDRLGVDRARQELVYLERIRGGGQASGIQLQTRRDQAAAAARKTGEKAH